MERSTLVLILLGGLMTSGFFWYWYYGGSSSSSPKDDPTGYRWDFEGPCIRHPEQTSTSTSCPSQSNPTLTAYPLKRQRSCDGKGIKPELQCQLRIMARTPLKTACQVFANSYSLPNLASFYLGARASVLENTTSYSPCSNGWGVWCDDEAFLSGIIQPGLLIVGKNYRFQGNRGSILIELAEPALISGVTLIHPLKCEIPNGYFSSAPKDFTVYGLANGVDEDPLELGRYIYKMTGPRAQTFPVKSKCMGGEMHKRVLVNFENNYGNPYYTAIYKFEVHGMFADNAGTSGQAISCSECG